MISPEVCQLLTYWKSLGGGVSIPNKAHLNLRALTHILPWMFILEISDDGTMTYRLAGSSLEAAIGRGMAGESYTSILSMLDQAVVLEELYSVALVQGCGLIRSGYFSLSHDQSLDLEVLVLPFSDARAVGGSIFVGVVKPFNYHNDSFLDKWGRQEEYITKLFAVPSPRLLQLHHLSHRVTDYLDEIGVDYRILDLDKVIEINSRGLHKDYVDVPSFGPDGEKQSYLLRIN